ncbi:hypothetical protein PanWU01x14_316490 [Parasponia andersonii]|uniref:Uncharacterized protein n=1 Tax=Parasponia andersonii TaxID=3476 RepID=A0A2P5AN23_PARAD|nr:hypothetical protein PanWU01x14_316490 [Parasponia andersonii]
MDPVTGMWPSEEVEQNYVTVVSSSLSISDSSTQSVPPRIDETLIADDMIGLRRGHRKGVSPKLKGATSTSSTVASLLQDPPILDSKFRDLFNQP